MVDPTGFEPVSRGLQSRANTNSAKDPNLAGKVGFEPTTFRLTADCSTTELQPNCLADLGGFEPPIFCLTGSRINRYATDPNFCRSS